MNDDEFTGWSDAALARVRRLLKDSPHLDYVIEQVATAPPFSQERLGRLAAILRQQPAKRSA